MSSGPKLLSLDAFAKTVEDARVKTASGGLITMICVLIVMLLIRNEYYDYTSVVIRPELVVNRDVNKQLDINLDITFPDIPCGVLTLDILDLTGDLHLDLFASGFDIFRVLPLGQEIKDDLPILSGINKIDEKCRGLTEEEIKEKRPCGSCYGALDQANSQYCCNTCESVRLAYATKQWGFYDGSDIEQCEKEGYVAKMKERISQNEGCRVKGLAKINRISGNLHFAPGTPFSARGRHSHDLSLWTKYPEKFTLNHKINHFSFGADPGSLLSIASPEEEDQVPSIHPLDGYTFTVDKKDHVALYYLSVVSTRVEFLENRKPAVDTNQFSVITHDRPIRGGRDDDHQNTLHAQGGVPGTFFHFDILPMKIINREEYAKTWSGFILGVVSSIAGVLTVGAVLDRSVWAAEQAIRGKKEL
ncbi:Endoplasmic Reticulum-Golgi Intermediate Compartment ERGIC [Metschnikowia aff. pulcherrima]|uniref:Endoplasmic reticulum-Golgi intermediate compartment protein n=1 Tax=Metschnikowia aff. pulcherrima TaxID=2163413 RepID=A0A4P6XFF8_9ASCO|nr:Endoplasmic Reticulum-Golgi Intermediate Compartment ERGIC [Metschnikowia aff. pulcherrima]